MLRIIQNNSAAGAKSYYSTPDYYVDGPQNGQELAGQWHGKGAAMLGLTGPGLSGAINKQEWDRLCDNQHPLTGSKLMPRTREERRIGYDLNFHAPKSLSMLYSLTHDERILEVFREAVQTTMDDMELEMQTRVRKNDQNLDRTTGNLVYGEFVHFAARPVDGVPDPHLHAHCFAFNTTFDREEKRWKAGQFAGLKRDAPYFEAAFHSVLARKLEELGLSVERTNDRWQIADIPVSISNKFSRRTEQIQREAKKRGINNPKEKDKLGARTRERKAKHLSAGELDAIWKDRLNADERAVINTLHHRIGKNTTPASEVAIQKAAHEAVQLAMNHCFERSAVVPHREVLARALKLGVGQATRAAVLDAAARSDMISREIGGRKMVTTRAVLAEEQAMLDFARSGRGTCAPLGKASDQPSRDYLSDEQIKAMQHVLTSTDRVILIRGAAGTGKTTLMQETVGAIERHGKHVLTFAPSAGASHGVLKEAGFVDADTVAMLLENPDTQARARGNVIWIDEAGLLGSRATKRVFDLAKELDARVILSGDKRQHGSVERGGTLQLLENQAGLIPAELRQVRRQDGAYKQAVLALSDGEVGEGFKRLDELGWIRQLPDREERYAFLAKAYVQSTEKPGTTLVVCPTHHEAANVTSEIRGLLRASHALGKDEQAFTSLKPVSLTDAERRDPLSYQRGDVLVFHKHAPGIRKGSKVEVSSNQPIPTQYADRFTVFRPATITFAIGDRIRITKNRQPQRGQTGPGNMRLNNGDLFTIKGITKQGELQLSNGATVSKDFGHVDYGYVITSHAAQGKSVDRVLIAQSSDSFRASSREQFYVSVSRGKKQATIFTDDKHALLEAVKQSDPRMTATDLVTMRVPQQIAKARTQRNRSQPGRPMRAPTKPRSAPSQPIRRPSMPPTHHREGYTHER